MRARFLFASEACMPLRILLLILAAPVLSGCAQKHAAVLSAQNIDTTSLATVAAPVAQPLPSVGITERQSVAFVRSFGGQIAKLNGLGRWMPSSEKSKMDDNATCTLSLEAKGKVVGWLANGTARLVLTITKNDAQLHLHSGVALYSTTGSRQGHYTPTRMRLDDLPADEQNIFPEENGSKLYFITRDRIPQLVRHKRLLIEVDAFNAGSNVIEFDLLGLDRALGWAAGRCLAQSL
jgi:hypothetical protein